MHLPQSEIYDPGKGLHSQYATVPRVVIAMSKGAEELMVELGVNSCIQYDDGSNSFTS